MTFVNVFFCRHSNGSASADDHHDGDDQPDDAGSLSRSDSEDNVAQIQNGHNNNNNGYTHKSTFNVYIFTQLHINTYTHTQSHTYKFIHYCMLYIRL